MNGDGLWFKGELLRPHLLRPSRRPGSRLWIAAKKMRKKSASLLKPGLLFLVFAMPRQAVQAPFGGSAETGAGGVRRLLVPILLNGGFGYENYLRFCSPLAVDHRL